MTIVVDQVRPWLMPSRTLAAITQPQVGAQMSSSGNVLDVRPAGEYAAGHLPGAVNIPVDELTDRLDELPADVL